MSTYNYAPGAVHLDFHHNNISMSASQITDIVRSFMSNNVEDVTPVQEEKPEFFNSIIFTKKAKSEGKIDAIIQALKTALYSRRDKSRALVQELKIWQNDGYVDAHWNAQVMYDEVAKIMPLPFGYEAFKQHYNNTRY